MYIVRLLTLLILFKFADCHEVTTVHCKLTSWDRSYCVSDTVGWVIWPV